MMTTTRTTRQIQHIRSETGQLLAAALLVITFGLSHLLTPFDGDQALFMLGALDLRDGYALYGDFWDIKQPGVFVFYLIGGNLFGFTEVGIHLFELLYLLAFVWVARYLLRDEFPSPVRCCSTSPGPVRRFLPTAGCSSICPRTSGIV